MDSVCVCLCSWPRHEGTTWLACGLMYVAKFKKKIIIIMIIIIIMTIRGRLGLRGNKTKGTTWLA